jgi:hypothetical protein
LARAKATPKAALVGWPPSGAFRFAASLLSAGSRRPIWTRPTPTMIFVSQSETSTRLLLAWYLPAFAVAAVIADRGMPNSSPTRPPARNEQLPTMIAVANTVQRTPLGSARA